VVSYSDLRDQTNDFARAWDAILSRLTAALATLNQAKGRVPEFLDMYNQVKAFIAEYDDESLRGAIRKSFIAGAHEGARKALMRAGQEGGESASGRRESLGDRFGKRLESLGESVGRFLGKRLVGLGESASGTRELLVRAIIERFEEGTRKFLMWAGQEGGGRGDSLGDLLRERLESLGPKGLELARNFVSSVGPAKLVRLESLEKEIEEVLENVPSEKDLESDAASFGRLARLVQGVQLVNLIVQATLLCVSLVSVAYQFNLVPPVAAIVAAAGGILCLTAVAYWLTKVRSIIKEIEEPLTEVTEIYEQAAAAFAEWDDIKYDLGVLESDRGKP